MNTNNQYNFLRESYHTNRPIGKMARPLWERLHIDLPLFLLIIVLIIAGLFILYSAGNQNFSLIAQQGLRFGLGLIIMIILAQIPPRHYYTWSPWIFIFGLLLLIAVLAIGHVEKGAQRWLTLGFFRFQPSELMKLAMPMMLAWFLSEKALPPSLMALLGCAILLIIPSALILKQPDLSTATMIIFSGLCVILLAGISWRLILSLFIVAALSVPVVWHFMHGYQKQRLITFFNPQEDPLGSSYHIIQSKIALGSGGIIGKGWLNGTQSHLQFLPEHATDFIFAVVGEEFGFIGGVILLMLFCGILVRCLYISTQAQNTYTRLLAGSLGLTFFISFFVNIGSVTGILPVMGLPLPLISYGGTSMVTMLAGFGIIMSIHTHRRMLSS